MGSDSDTADLVLASRSPRRLELVRRLGLEVEVRPSDIPEVQQPDESPTAYTERLAEQKATDVAEDLADEPGLPSWILAADTIVVLDESVLEKPGSPEAAREMLDAMTGNWHEVVTSFCLLERRRDDTYVRTSTTRVRMRQLSDAWIRQYVATGEPMDKSGSYGIQDFGALLVDELRGSYFNVVGLPIAQLAETIESIDALEIHPILDAADRDEPTDDE